MEITMGKKQKKVTIKLRVLVEKINSLTLAASIIIIFLTGLFLYNNFYNGLREIKALASLKSQVATKMVDMEAWEKVNQQKNQKERGLDNWEIEHLPF